MRVIDYTLLSYVNRGYYGDYYRLNALQGVKLIGRAMPRVEVPRSSWGILARLEGHYMKSAYPIAPRHYGTVLVRYKGSYCLGVLMEHVEGEAAELTEAELEGIQEAIRDKGLLHKDLRPDNVLRTSKGFRVVDWGPNGVERWCV